MKEIIDKKKCDEFLKEVKNSNSLAESQIDVFEAIKKLNIDEVRKWIEENSKDLFVENRVRLSEAFWESRKILGNLNDFNNNYSWLVQEVTETETFVLDGNHKLEDDIVPTELAIKIRPDFVNVPVGGGMGFPSNGVGITSNNNLMKRKNKELFEQEMFEQLSIHEKVEFIYQNSNQQITSVAPKVRKQYEFFNLKSMKMFQLLARANEAVFFEKFSLSEEKEIDLVMLKSWIEHCDESFVLKALSIEIEDFLNSGKLSTEDFVRLVQLSIGLNRADNVNVFPKSSPKYIGLGVLLLNDEGLNSLVKKIGNAYVKISGALCNTAFVLTLDSLQQLKRTASEGMVFESVCSLSDVLSKESKSRPYGANEKVGYSNHAMFYNKRLYGALLGTKSLIFEKWDEYQIWEKSTENVRIKIEEEKRLCASKWSASAIREWNGWFVGADGLSFCWLISKYPGYIDYLNKTNGFCISLGSTDKFKYFFSTNSKVEEVLSEASIVSTKTVYKDLCLELKKYCWIDSRDKQFLWNCDLVSALLFFDKHKTLEVISKVSPASVECFCDSLQRSVQSQKMQGEFVKTISNEDMVWLNLLSSYKEHPYEKILDNFISVQELPRLLLGNIAQLKSYEFVCFKSGSKQHANELLDLYKKVPELFFQENFYKENVFKILTNFSEISEVQSLLVELESKHLSEQGSLGNDSTGKVVRL